MMKFEELLKINVNDHTENKNGLTYLSWTWAVSEIKKQCPDFKYEILKFDNNLPYVYDENTGYMVFTKVTIGDETNEMWLPVMDGNNKAMLNHEYKYQVKKYEQGKWTGEYVEKTVEPATMFDINKTIMRCLVKNVSLFGLGLYIYAGEDLPEKPKEYITQEQIDEMKKLGVKIDGVLKSFNVSDITLLEKTQADYVITSKRNYLEKQKKESESNGNNA